MVSEEELRQDYEKYMQSRNEESLKRKDEAEKKRVGEIKTHNESRNKLAEEIAEIVRNEGEEEIKKMPFRNYLMEFVVPTLNDGLLEVSNIIPNDPVDLLAEYLYQKSYDV